MGPTIAKTDDTVKANVCPGPDVGDCAPVESVVRSTERLCGKGCPP